MTERRRSISLSHSRTSESSDSLQPDGNTNINVTNNNDDNNNNNNNQQDGNNRVNQFVLNLENNIQQDKIQNQPIHNNNNVVKPWVNNNNNNNSFTDKIGDKLSKLITALYPKAQGSDDSCLGWIFGYGIGLYCYYFIWSIPIVFGVVVSVYFDMTWFYYFYVLFPIGLGIVLFLLVCATCAWESQWPWVLAAIGVGIWLIPISIIIIGATFVGAIFWRFIYGSASQKAARLGVGSSSLCILAALILGAFFVTHDYRLENRVPDVVINHRYDASLLQEGKYYALEDGLKVNLNWDSFCPIIPLTYSNTSTIWVSCTEEERKKEEPGMTESNLNKFYISLASNSDFEEDASYYTKDKQMVTLHKNMIERSEDTLTGVTIAFLAIGPCWPLVSLLTVAVGKSY